MGNRLRYIKPGDPYREPNRKAPRNIRVGGSILFRFKKDFLMKYPQYKGLVQETDLTKVVEAFGDEFKKEVVKNPYGAELPAFLGAIALTGFKPEGGMMVDMNKTREMGYYVFRPLLSTDGRWYSLLYYSYLGRYNWAGRDLYYLEPDQNFRELARTEYPKRYNKYFIMKGRYSMYKLFRECFRGDSMERKLKKIEERRKKVALFNESIKDK